MNKFIKALFIIATVFLTACSSSDAANSVAANDDDSSEVKMKILIAYFSNTGTTKGIAESAANSLSGDYETTLFEIQAKEPYTSADLNYNNDNSRANGEQNSDTARPEIANILKDADKYDAILLGYPIWWGKAPRIILTFLEEYDFSEKKIIPFCTSGSSSINGSIDEIKAAEPNATILKGKRFEANESENEIGDWFKELLR